MKDEIVLAQQALQDLSKGLDADGYELVVLEANDDVVEVAVRALDGACEDCLVPKELMAPMIQSTLPPPLAAGRVVLHYPNER